MTVELSSQYDVNDLRIYRSTDGEGYTLLNQVQFNQYTYDDPTSEYGHIYCYYVKEYDILRFDWLLLSNESCIATFDTIGCQYIVNSHKSFDVSSQYNVIPI